MIHPTELRIGTTVYYNGTHKEVGTVTGVTKYLDGSCLVNLNGRVNGLYKIEELSPIPITEEILLKCNFKKCEDKNCPGKCYIIDIGDEKDLSYCFKSYNVEYNCIYLNTKKIKIDYLHQLQNFIFVYTGVELDVSGVVE